MKGQLQLANLPPWRCSATGTAVWEEAMKKRRRHPVACKTCHANHFILEKSSADRAMRALENSQGPQRRSQLRLAVLRDQELQQHILSSE